MLARHRCSARGGSARRSGLPIVALLSEAGVQARRPPAPHSCCLQTLAPKLNPLVKYFDPLKLGEAQFWDNTNEETIGWLRHSEIKHGRVAMAAFVGYVAQANGVKFPWAPFNTITTLSPPEQWDQLASVRDAPTLAAAAILPFLSGAGTKVLTRFLHRPSPFRWPSGRSFSQLASSSGGPRSASTGPRTT